MITVVVPVYNMGDYLEQCMDSLLEQTYTDYEIIIVDDGSRREDAKACDRQAARSPKVRVIHKENGGVSSARNCGIMQAQGDYIIFVDPDDWMEKDGLASLIELRERSGADISICGYYCNEKGQDILPQRIWPADVYSRETALKLVVMPNGPLMGCTWNKLYSMDVIRDHNLCFDEELLAVQDLHFTFRYFLCCRLIAYDPRPIYHYRSDGNGVSMMTSPQMKRKMSAFKAYEKIAALAQEVGDSEMVKMININECHYATKVLYSYYANKMRDQEALSRILGVLKDHKADYFPNDYYSRRHQLLARIALVSPRLYYILLRAKRKLFGQES